MVKEADDNTYGMSDYFKETFKQDHEPYSGNVHDALNKLIISEIVDHNNYNILVIGRKGLNLFQPYITAINQTNNLQEIYTIRLFSHTKHPMIRPVGPRGHSDHRPINKKESIKDGCSSSQYILLTDAINTGDEIQKVMNTIEPESISKICGYLANKDKLSELQKNYPNIQFSFIKIENEDEYTLEQDRLQHISQSRLIPTDGEHPYRIYSLKYQVSTEDLVNHMDNIFSKFKSDGYRLLKKDYLIVPNISSYTINLDYSKLCEENPELIQPYYVIERMQVRFKIDPKVSKLMIMALALDLTNNIYIHTNGKCHIEYNKCGINIHDKMCEKVEMPTPMEDNPRDKICPLCIDFNISNLLISYAENELFKILESNGVKIEQTEI